METDFSSHSTNSIYYELLDGKMLSTVTASAVVTTVQFVLRFVVDCFLWMLMSACISMEKNKKSEKRACKNAEPFFLYL